MREECGRVLSGRSRPAYGYAVVDLEATGSSSHRHRVIELAVVLLDRDLVPQGEFTTLVDPQGPVGPTHIHGIQPEHLSGAPRFAGIAARLLTLLRGRVLVGHNVGCDRAFLVAEYARLGLRLPRRGVDRPALSGGGQPLQSISPAPVRLRCAARCHCPEPSGCLLCNPRLQSCSYPR